MDKQDKFICALTLIGAALVIAGIAMINVPAAFIVAGCLIFFTGVRMAKEKAKFTKHNSF